MVLPRTTTVLGTAMAAIAGASLLGCAAPEARAVPDEPAPPAVRVPEPVAAVAPAMPRGRPPAAADTDTWNGAQIAWRSFDDGRAEAARTRKPMMLVFYTSWCPHCRNFSHVFDDASVVAAARDFVMVRANGDEERELSQRFAPDGTYIPRTFFLSSGGELAPSLKAHEGRFQYFYDEHDAAALVAAMRRAQAAL